MGVRSLIFFLGSRRFLRLVLLEPGASGMATCPNACPKTSIGSWASHTAGKHLGFQGFNLSFIVLKWIMSV